MGQYYMALLERDGNSPFVFDRSIDKNYTMAKLMEHSWWRNPAVNTFCSLIYHNPAKVSWVGDYADTESVLQEKKLISKERLNEIYQTVWGDKADSKGLKENQLDLQGKYLCNHTYHKYLDLDKYYNECVLNGWCIHPLPLLTAIGNDQGGGDFHDAPDNVGYDDVGIWADTLISIEDTIPDNYEECFYRFIEG